MFATKAPFASAGDRHRAGRFGMWLFLVSLGMLFAATVVGYVVVRYQLRAKGLWPDDLPGLPPGLLASTTVLLVSSVTMHLALRHAADDDDRRLRRFLNLTLGLGVLFLALQTWAWLSWTGVVRERWPESDEWRFALTGFYLLTGLHAIHVLGGLIALAVTRARNTGEHRRPDPGDRTHAVETCAMYWHFLDGVWLTLYVMLFVAASV